MRLSSLLPGYSLWYHNDVQTLPLTKFKVIEIELAEMGRLYIQGCIINSVFLLKIPNMFVEVKAITFLYLLLLLKIIWIVYFLPFDDSVLHE